ncbi:hypothetical protein [Yinghuangia sp. YIM S09857]|uniref:hypothetical protein n=1 Tax=Yinghuangia sp. YIM S09857 TaxID=3436929 RepID=UPI003F53B721
MARPADWSALGLSGDPTPGDPDRIDRVIAAELEYIELAKTIDSGLTEIKNTADGVFVGKTADALRGVIDGNLRNYISTYKTAHEDVRGALIVYVAAMREQQRIADAALTAANGLAEDDESGRETQKTVAENARETLEDAAGVLEGVLDSAAESIASPVDECEEFWKALTWIAIILIVPAIIFGGPMALLAIGLNVALLIKTAIDFAHGKAGVTELVLAVLGVIAPTTKGLHLGNLWNVIKGLGSRGLIGTKNFFLGGANSFGLFARTGLGIDSAFAAAGSWIRGGIQGLKLGPVFTNVPELARFGGSFNGIRFFPLATELTVINLAGARTFFGLRSIMTTINSFKSLGSTIAHGLSGAKGLRLFLPVAADEMGTGLGLAFRIGFIDRGIFGMYRYGAFMNGHFLGAGSKISGGVGGGIGAFGPGGQLVPLGHVNVGGMGANGIGAFDTRFDIPPINTRFTSGFDNFGKVTVPNGLGSFGGNFNAGNFPPLGTFLDNSGNLGALVPFGGLGAKFADIPALGLNNLGLTNFAGNLGVPPSVNGLGAAGLNPVPSALGHISITNLDTVANGAAKIDLGMPTSTHLVNDLPTPGALAAPADGQGLNGAAMPQPGHPAAPQLGQTALPHAAMPDAHATPAADLNGSPTPSVGHPAGSSLQTPGLGNIQLPNADAQLVDVPPLSAHNLGSPATLGLGDNAVVNAHGLGGGAVVNVHGIGGGAQFVPANAGARNNVNVFALTHVEYDFAHTFDRIPGLAGVEVRVTPGTQSGRAVDIDIQPVNVRDDVSAAHLTVGDQNILRIERELGDGLVQRWDYELNARNDHQLLNEQVFDADAPGQVPGPHGGSALPHVPHTGIDPVPSRYAELYEMTTPAPGGTDLTVAMMSGTHLAGGTAAPVRHLIDLPHLPGGRIEVQMDGHGGVTGIQPRGTGGGAVPNVTTTHAANPAGGTTVRVDEIVVPNVETRRWTVDIDGSGGTVVRTERIFTLHGGPHDNSVVNVTVDGHGAATWVTHTSGGTPVPQPGGRATEFNAAGIVVPQPGGFRVHDPATGAPSGTGLQLVAGNGTPLNLHVLTPDHGGGATLVGADGTGSLGTVTTPAHTNGQFHVLPNGTGPTVRVFDSTGHFSHESLPLANLDGLHVPGGHIRNPHGANPQLAGPDGQPVPHTAVATQINHEFRITYAGGQFHVDAAGNRAHDVVPLTGAGPAAGQYVFTPAAGGSPLPVPRDANGNPSGTVTVAHVDNTFHVNTGQADNTLSVHTPGGAFSHSAIRLIGGGAPGGFIRLPDAAGGNVPQLTRGNGTAIANTTVTPQQAGGHLVQHRHGAIAVDAGGTHTHNVVQAIGLNNTPLGQFVHTPVGTHAPVANPANVRGVPDATVTVTRAGGELRLTGAGGSFTAHGTDGAHRFTAIRVQAGPIGGNFVRVDAAGTRLVNPHLRPISGDVAAQTGLPGGGFRIDRGAGGHLVVDPRGVARFDVVGLRNADGTAANQFVFTPSAHAPGAIGGPAAAPLPALHGPNGTTLGGFTVGTRPDGSLQITDASTIRVHDPAGAFDFRATRLTTPNGTHLGENIRVLPSGTAHLVDGNFVQIPGSVVRPRTGGGHHIDANGGFRLFDANGRLDFTATPGQIAHGGRNINVLHIADGTGTHRFDALRPSDGQITNPAQAQLVDITAGGLRLLDGDLTVLPNTVTARPGGAGYQVNGVGGQAGEFRRFDPAGQLEFQRINMVRGDGRPLTTRHFEVTYAGDTGTWATVKLNVTGHVIPTPGAPKWFEGGTVDTAGAGAGRVHLVSHTGTTVFERRFLPGPGGGVLDAHHSTASLGEFSHFNQRGPWAEFDANGNLVAHGTRHWGESTRSYHDVRSVLGVNVRVRHFQASGDGGHVLATMNNTPATQSIASGPWVRFDADFQPVATGTRHWGPGRGFTDTMPHPITNETVKVQEKFGRFQFGLHDVRRFHQVEMGADGVPKRDYLSRHPDGNPNGYGKTLQNGDFLEYKRFAEQRPPVWFREMFNSTLRNTDLNANAWLRDSRMRVGSWSQEPAGGGPRTVGAHFIANNKATFEVASTGDIVRETRTLLNGSTLTVGDVRLPVSTTTGNQVAHRNNYLPWNEGAGNLSGHRTYVAGDFVNTPGTGTKTIAWQDRYTTNLGDGDWYTPNAAKNWHVIRTGFTDGTYIDYRPQPLVRPDGAAGNAGQVFRGSVNSTNSDWTMYDPHGVVVARSDTFPDPNATGAGNATITVVGTMGADTRHFQWQSGGATGVRVTSFEKQISPWQFDRESFQDFDGAGRLIRDHRQLGEGMSVDAWRAGVDAHGNEVWRWNKYDAHGNMLDFGGGVNNRVRHWFDAQGNQLTRWQEGARWSDRLPAMGNRVVQEIPAPKPPARSIRAYFSDVPFRVRDYSPTINTHTPFNGNIWQESDQGIITRKKVRLGDGTYLETEAFNKHARRYDVNGITPVNDRSISGYISEYNFNGGTSHIGRETHFTGILNEYRGNNRVFREVNRWEFGPSMQGEAVDTPFALKAIESIGIDMTHEFLLDFTMNLVVLTMVRILGGRLPDTMDVARAAFGAAMSSIGKGAVAGAHMAAHRGGWKVHWSNIDYGQPGSWRPNDDSWNTEWGAIERPTRWRGGLYEYSLGLGTGALTSFVSGASQAALFGARTADGALVTYTGGGAAMAGLTSAITGFLDGISVGALRTLVQHSVGSRWIHRQGPGDIFGMGAIGKFGEKTFALLVLQPAVVKWLGLNRDTFIIPVPGTGG